MNDTVLARWERHNEAGKRLLGAGELAAAEQAFIAAIREATLLGADNERLATSLSHLGQIKFRERDLSQAEALLRRSLAIRERTLGDDHASLIPAINNLASVTAAAGELSNAEPLFRRALALSDRHFGERHPGAAAPLNSLTRVYLKLGEFAAAEPLLQRLLTIKRDVLGPEHAEVATIFTSLARARLAMGDAAGAEEPARAALRIRERTAAGDPAARTVTLETLADVCDALQRAEEAAELRARAREGNRRTGGDRESSAPRTRTMPIQAPTPPASRKLTPPFTRQLSRPMRRTPAARDDVVWVQPASPNADVPAGSSPGRTPQRASMPLFAPTTSRTTGSMSAIVVPVGAPELFTPPAPPVSEQALDSSPALAPSRFEPRRSAPRPAVHERVTAEPDAAEPDAHDDARARRSSGAALAPDEEGDSFRIRRAGLRAPQWLADPRRPWLKFVAAASVAVIAGASIWALSARRSDASPPAPSDPVASSEQGASLSEPAPSRPAAQPPVSQPAGTQPTPQPPSPSTATTDASSHALDRMATATLPHATGGGKSAHATQAEHDSAAAVPGPLPAAGLVNTKLNHLTDALDKRATARADSLGRSVTIKPPSFEKP